MARPRHSDGLVGRCWAVARIADWLRSDSPVLVVSGAAGTGKTTLIRALAAGDCPAAPAMTFHAVHLCRAHVPASIDPIRVLGEIAGQLTRTVPGYEVFGSGGGRPPGCDNSPHRLATRAVLDSPNAAAAYEKSLYLPFEVLALRRRRRGADAGRDGDVVVVVDGLDEAPSGVAGSGLVELLAERLDNPGAGLRLLLTARSGPAVDRLSPELRLDLTADRPDGVDDVREYLDAVSGLPRQRRAAIADAAGDSYLYAQLATWLAGSADAWYQPPPGLSALYEEALARLGAPESTPRLVFAALARVRDEGFTVDQLAALLRTDPATVTTALDRGRRLVTGSDRIRPYHRCLSEHLWATAAEPGAEDWLIGEHLRRRGAARRLASGEEYALRNMLPHLADASVTAFPRARATIRLALSGPVYVTSALMRIGVDDLLCALSYVERRTGRPADGSGTLARVLRRQAPYLRQAFELVDPTLASQQVVYEAATVGAVELARRFATCLPAAGILTLWATSDSRARLLPNATPGHAGRVTSVVVTGDGTTAITASKDHATRVWRLASGRLAYTVPTPADVSNIYADPGMTHVVASTTDGRVQVWDAGNGAPIMEIPTFRTALVTSFAADSTGTVGVGGDADGNATVWDLTAGEPVRRLPCRTLVTAVAITPDASVAATGSAHGDVTVWDLATGAPRIRLSGGTRVCSLALTPAADRLVVGSESLTVYALTPTGRARRAAELFTSGAVTAAMINPVMPDYLLFGGAGGQIAYVRLPVDEPPSG
jgi:hypothetical protein